MAPHGIRLIGLVSVVLIAPLAWPQQGTDADAEPWIDVVLAVFSARCVDCHNPAGSRSARGAWDDAANLAALREDFIFSDGQPPNDIEIETTTLWNILHEEPDFRMPPPGAKSGDLTEAEMLVVRRWLELGAPLPGAITAAGNEAGTRVSPTETTDDALDVTDVDTESMPTGKRLRHWLGRLHPPAVHLPIGLLLAAALAELLVMCTQGRHFVAARRFCTVVACLAAISAVVLGWFAGESSLPSQTLTLHRWSGIALAGLLVVVAILGELAAREEHRKSRFAFRIGLIVCVALVGWVGHLGGVMVFGEGYLAW